MKTNLMSLIFLFLNAIFLGSLGAWTAYKLGDRFGFVDYPKQRSSHNVPTPKGGGIGIIATFLFASIFYDMAPFFWISAVSIAMISFFGDRVEIPVRYRLFAQFFAAFVFLLISSLNKNNGVTIWPVAKVILLTVYLVATANFFNFMDGINGIAGICGLIAFWLLGVYGIFENIREEYIFFSFCMGFSCLGFLPFNFPNARVFMGDGGSILIGFVFAAMAAQVSNSLTDLLCLSCFLFPIYADSIFTLFIRLINREQLTHPHRKHLYQLFANQLRIQHWKVSLSYGIIQFLVGISIIYINKESIQIMLSILSYSVCFILISICVRKKVKKVDNVSF